MTDKNTASSAPSGEALDINDDGHFAGLLGNMHPLSKQCAIDFVNTWAHGQLTKVAAAAGEVLATTASERAVELLPVGTLAWALIAANGNIIIWSRNRSTVERYSSRYPEATLTPIIGASPAATTASASIEGLTSYTGDAIKVFKVFGDTAFYKKSDVERVLSSYSPAPSRDAAPLDGLRAAAAAVVERWDSPKWKDEPHTAVFIDRLRAALAQQSAERADRIRNTDHVGRNLDGVPQPYAGAIVLLETIAECGALAFVGEQRTPMSETCTRFANDLRTVAGRRAAETGAGAAAEDAARLDWSKKPPTEQGDYWHWTGDVDHAPIIYHVMWSGSANKCFLSIGQYDIKEAIWCDKYGGWWKLIQQPAHPGDAPAGEKGKA